jgi:arsenate reductase
VSVTLYGIPNCDKCRSAIKWFRGQSCEFQFHDLRAGGIENSLLQRWQNIVGNDAMLNKRSQTWRAIPEAERTGLDAKSIRSLILAHPTVIKRPVVDDGINVQFGYDEAAWKQLLL